MPDKNVTHKPDAHDRGGASDGHVHLQMVRHEHGAKPRWDWARWPVFVLAAASVALFATSYFQPWWHFWLYAPQYPSGLELIISLTGMGGQVHEVDILNHYIGMRHLADAAPTERQLAGYGVAIVSIVTFAFLMFSGKKLNKIVAIPAIMFPIGFLADSFYWLYTFGHDLDPKAPIKIQAFTPEMFGNGKIGQFETFAAPDLGFWLAVAGVVCALGSAFLRSRVCSNCPNAGECSAVCPRAMVMSARSRKSS
ncbi:MAG: hypothetical protein IPM54_12220 [Polyangiaceae bacterium]|nr:hypothetical protein [Polyangiaceae bacterium]